MVKNSHHTSWTMVEISDIEQQKIILQVPEISS